MGVYVCSETTRLLTKFGNLVTLDENCEEKSESQTTEYTEACSAQGLDAVLDSLRYLGTTLHY